VPSFRLAWRVAANNHGRGRPKPPPRASWGASVARCPPDRAYLTEVKQRVPYGCCCRWQLQVWPGNGGTMPSESKTPLPRASSLFRPHTETSGLSIPREKMVEAPGTAPGSATLIPSSIYRHSRRTDRPNIGDPGVGWKGAGLRRCERGGDPAAARWCPPALPAQEPGAPTQPAAWQPPACALRPTSARDRHRA
jgi:hypothetical protein